MSQKTIIKNIQTLYTPYHKPPIKGHLMKDIRIIHDCHIMIEDGIITNIIEKDHDFDMRDDFEIIDAKGMIALPGFIDGHSHLIHAGSREEEFALLHQGVPYMDILKSGKGILSTVKATREASFKSLYERALKSINTMMLYGVTTLEVKSGYGLSLQQEIKQLEVAKALKRRHPVDIYSTYMGAHAVPEEYKANPSLYVDAIIKDMQIIKELHLAQSVDVFCESHVFDLKETRKLLNHAKALSFDIRLHADEIEPLGGAGLGVEFKAKSVDHLMAISDHDIQRLAKSDTIANVLPGTSFYLGKSYAPARRMIDHGVALGIGGDYNPGSCPTENYQLILQIAANQLDLDAREVLTAATINPAYHLGKSDHKGSITIGKQADIILLDVPNLDYAFYHFGINHVNDVIIKGHHVVKNKLINKEFI